MLNQPDGPTGILINGVFNGDEAGRSVSFSGDVNGDGMPDILIGAPFADPNNVFGSGQAYVIYGNESLPPVIELTNLNPTNPSLAGITINGIDMNDVLGITVSNAGDINNDGIDDIAIGADMADPGGMLTAGEVYVVYGQKNFPEIINVSLLNLENGVPGILINGFNSLGRLGNSIDGGGDFNNDGVNDLILGTRAEHPITGELVDHTFIIFGSDQLPETIDLNQYVIDQNGGVVLYGIGATIAFRTNPVNFIGDINGDGISDILTSTPNLEVDSLPNVGGIFIIYGSENLPNEIDLSELNQPGSASGVLITGTQEGNQSGSSISNAGDVNDDGLDDILIGATLASPNNANASGQSYLIYGSENLPSEFNLPEINNINFVNGVIINGAAESDFSGNVNAAGDVNADGFDDIIIGAGGAEPNGNINAGKIYLIHGGANLPDAIELSNLDDIDSVIYHGIDPFDSVSLSTKIGDMNRDGVDDFIISAFEADPDGRDEAGELYVIYGGLEEVFFINGFE